MNKQTKSHPIDLAVEKLLSDKIKELEAEINQSHKLISELQCEITSLKLQKNEMIDVLKMVEQKQIIMLENCGLHMMEDERVAVRKLLNKLEVK